MIENYEILKNGVIKQKTILKKIKSYNLNYVNNSYNQYGEKGPQISGIRLGYLIATLGYWPQSILDVGYGNGDFLKVCKGVIDSYGNDVSGYPVPEGVTYTDNIFNKHYDVISFFDVLEHFNEMGYDMVDYSNIEDLIRTTEHEYPNILTCIFKKRKINN